MKIILLLLVCLIQYSINKTEGGRIVSVRSMYGIIPCKEFDNTPYYGLYFDALVTGFSKADKIYFSLASPKYITVECDVPAESSDEQSVYCYVNADKFPQFQKNVVTLPANLETSNDVTIEDWNKYFSQNLDMTVDVCSRKVEYSFTLNSKFTSSCDDKGQNILSGNGSFKALSNSLTSSEPVTYKFQPYIYSDNVLTYADCYVLKYPDENSSEEEEIKCAVIGNRNAIFFQTSSLVNDEGKYMVFDLGEGVSGEVGLKECSSTFVKIGLLLLLSIFLL